MMSFIPHQIPSKHIESISNPLEVRSKLIQSLPNPPLNYRFPTKSNLNQAAAGRSAAVGEPWPTCSNGWTSVLKGSRLQWRRKVF